MSIGARLFWGLISTQCLLPLMHGNVLGQVTVRILTIVVLLLGLRAVEHAGRPTRLGVWLAIPAALLPLTISFYPQPPLILASLVAGLLFDVWLVVALVGLVMHPRQPGDGVVYLALVAYILAWQIFGTLYLLTDMFQPGSLQGRVTPEGPISISLGDALYFSMVALTTAGFGEIVPASEMARTLVSLETMFGVLYPCVMISRLVAMTESQARRNE